MESEKVNKSVRSLGACLKLLRSARKDILLDGTVENSQTAKTLLEAELLIDECIEILTEVKS